MFLSLSDRTLLQNMLNSEDFKMIRLDPNSGDLDFGDKVLARLVGLPYIFQKNIVCLVTGRESQREWRKIKT